MFDEFMVSLPSVQHKTLGVLLMHSFQFRQKMNVKDSEVEARSIVGYNEKMVRKHSKEFFKNHGKFTETNPGKYKRHCLLNDKDLQLEALFLFFVQRPPLMALLSLLYIYTMR